MLTFERSFHLAEDEGLIGAEDPTDSTDESGSPSTWDSSSPTAHSLARNAAYLFCIALCTIAIPSAGGSIFAVYVYPRTLALTLALRMWLVGWLVSAGAVGLAGTVLVRVGNVVGMHGWELRRCRDVETGGQVFEIVVSICVLCSAYSLAVGTLVLPQDGAGTMSVQDAPFAGIMGTVLSVGLLAFWMFAKAVWVVRRDKKLPIGSRV